MTARNVIPGPFPAAARPREEARPGPRPDPRAGVEPTLDLRGVTTRFPGEDGPITIVDDVSLSVRPGETLAVVGESGSGKTMTFLSAIGLLPPPGKVVSGQVLLDGTDLLTLSTEELRRHRGSGISMVFQDPLTGLNPVFTIGDQIAEVLRAHKPMSRSEARRRAVELLDRVHIPDPTRRVDDFPHQLSGGMRQRVLIAMAIALEPRVLIADEPTTALDVTVQAQVLELLAELRDEAGMAMVLITHDLGLVARHADRVAVMYAGRVVERGPIEAVFDDTAHPYTVSLFESVPHLDSDSAADLRPIEGQPPNPAFLPAGCAFEARCFLGRGREDCLSRRPALGAAGSGGHEAACHHAAELRKGEGRP
ncbi:MAG: ABC transporter ATP-binding protein [Alphaproteobacteria bacterium]|nr:ABC transporter ATP-binding protein [Alphaproteobacteria bacterium]MDX5370262.1 ABC transporter ATP-binding protein [Alphaproteobacteria bacterium]MDX5464804.1 ABC transporter ATP-binding protein [Alphaproteobacteria bacterium]